MKRRRTNPAPMVPVLLLNPSDKVGEKKMATRRRTTTRRRRTSTRKGQVRKTARRAYTSRRPNPARRRRRRRTNPRGTDIKGSIWAAAAGVGVGAAMVALDSAKGDWATPKNTAGALLAGGAVLGLVANKYIGQDLGKGVIAGAAALGGYKMYKAMSLEKATTTQTKGMGHIFNPPQLDAVQSRLQPGQFATLNAVTSEVAPGYQVNLNDAYYGGY
jgi:hypothetical protein